MDLHPKYDNYDFPTTAAEPQDGHAGYLTPEKIAQVHQLRLMLEAEGFKDRLDTLTLVRVVHAVLPVPPFPPPFTRRFLSLELLLRGHGPQPALSGPWPPVVPPLVPTVNGTTGMTPR